MFTSTFIPERNCFRVVVNDKDGPVSKLFSVADYQTFIESVFEHEALTPSCLGVIEPLPPEFLRARFDTKEMTGWAAYRLPAGYYPVFFKPDINDAKSYLVHFPDTLWCIHSTRGVVTNIHLYCLFDEELKDGTILWRLPLSNVYHDGRICLGANKWRFKSLNDFRVLTNEFFSAPHERALYNAKEYGMPLEEMFSVLEKDGVTIKTAKPCGTFGDLVKSNSLGAFL